jgi:hypothetical protein
VASQRSPLLESKFSAISTFVCRRQLEFNRQEWPRGSGWPRTCSGDILRYLLSVLQDEGIVAFPSRSGLAIRDFCTTGSNPWRCGWGNDALHCWWRALSTQSRGWLAAGSQSHNASLCPFGVACCAILAPRATNGSLLTPRATDSSPEHSRIGNIFKSQSNNEPNTYS